MRSVTGPRLREPSRRRRKVHDPEARQILDGRTFDDYSIHWVSIIRFVAVDGEDRSIWHLRSQNPASPWDGVTPGTVLRWTLVAFLFQVS